jgi:hypothetical protein
MICSDQNPLQSNSGCSDNGEGSYVNDYEVTVAVLTDLGPVSEVCGSEYEQGESDNDSRGSNNVVVQCSLLQSANVIRRTASDVRRESLSADIGFGSFYSIKYCHL